MNVLLTALVSSASVALLIFVVILLNPDKVEKWVAMIWKALSLCGGVFKSAHKRYVAHDLQGRVNDFVRHLQRDIPSIGGEKLKVDWVGDEVDRKAFIDKGKVVVRLRRNDPEDHNFVHGAFLYVSNTLLKKAKRYLSPSQKVAIDLFVCSKIIQKEKESVAAFYVDEYLHPYTAERKSKVGEYIDDFAQIDRGGMFSPVLLQELQYIGDKVFGRRRDEQIIAEVNKLINFLKPIANRTIGDENDLDFEGDYCRFGLIIIGKPVKMLYSLDPYIRYMERHMVKAAAETYYVLARLENKDKVDQICQRFAADYEVVRRASYTRLLKYEDRTVRAKQYLAVLRKRDIAIIQASA